MSIAVVTNRIPKVAGLLTLISIFLSACSSQEDVKELKPFPDLYDIQAIYCMTHQEADAYMTFEKRQDGWYAVKNTVEKGAYKEIGREKVWDAKTASYTEGYAAELPGELSTEIRSCIKGVDYIAYLLPVYGYKGAEEEAIELLEAQSIENLQAEQLEGLARAYSDLAGKEILRGERHKNYLLPYDTSYQKEGFPKVRIDQAEKYAWKSLDYLEELRQKADKEYETIVGDPTQMLSNFAMHYYLLFNTIQQQSKADKFMTVVDYSKFQIDNAKNFLKSCAANAILLSAGDNDFYPLIYVQNQLNYRRDVTVLHEPSTSIGRMILWWTKLLPGDKAIQTFLPMNQYHADVNNYIPVLEEPNSAYVSIEEVLKRFVDGAGPSNTSAFGAKYIPTKLVIPVGDGVQELDLSNLRSILKEDLFLLDLIFSNQEERPIYFTLGVRRGLRKILDDYVRQEGMLIRLMPDIQQQGSALGRFPHLVAEDVAHFLLNEAEFSTVNPEELNRHGNHALALYYPYLAYMLFNQAIEEGQAPPKVDSIRKKLYKYFPIDKFNYGNIHLSFAKLYLDLADKELAKAHTAAYIKELEIEHAKTLLPKADQSSFQRWRGGSDKKYLKLRVQALQDFVEQQNWPELLQEIENWRE